MRYRYSEKSTYVIKLAPLEKALVDYINRKYMFYEFIIDRYYYLFKAIPKPKKRIYAYIPSWMYEFLDSISLNNNVSKYLNTVIIKNLFNAFDVYSQPLKAVRVYDTMATFFGLRITVPESIRGEIEKLVSSSYAKHYTKVFSAYSNIAKHLRWGKKRYGLTRRNTLLLYLAYFTTMKEKMMR